LIIDRNRRCGGSKRQRAARMTVVR